MRTSLNPLMYINSKKFEKLFEEVTALPQKLTLSPGKYYVAGRAGGGAGSYGAGGVGGFFENVFEINNSVDATFLVGDGGKTFDNGGNGGAYSLFVPEFTFTIVPTPSNAKVTLIATGVAPASSGIDLGETSDTSINEYIDGGLSFSSSTYNDLGEFQYKQEGNSITVAAGTNVTYTVEAPGYITKTGTVQILQDKTSYISLVYNMKVLTVNVVDPYDATVEFSTGTIQGNKCTVETGTSVTYTVKREGYYSQTKTITVSTDTTVNVSLVQAITISIIPEPADANIVLTATGYTQTNNSITVPYGTNVTYTVSKDGYETQTASFEAIVDKELSIFLSKIVVPNYTLTINTTPKDATVLLNVSEEQVSYGSITDSQISSTIDGGNTLSTSDYITLGDVANETNTIVVPQGTLVQYSVSKDGYATKHDSVTVIQDTVIDVSLNPQQ